MIATTKRLVENKPAHDRRLAKKRVQCLNEVLCSVSSLSRAGRQFSASKSASSPSAKPLCAILKRPENDNIN